MSDGTESQIAPILPDSREDKICVDFMDAGFLGKLWFGIKIWFGFVLAFILIAAIIASGVGVYLHLSTRRRSNEFQSIRLNN